MAKKVLYEFKRGGRKLRIVASMAGESSPLLETFDGEWSEVPCWGPWITHRGQVEYVMMHEILRMSAALAESEERARRARVEGMRELEQAILEFGQDEHNNLHNMEHAGLCSARIVAQDLIAAAERERNQEGEES